MDRSPDAAMEAGALAGERRRVARDLHDEVAAGLGAALTSFELYDMYRDTRPELAQRKLAAARDAVRASLENLRGVMAGLRTPVESTDTTGTASPVPLAAALAHDPATTDRAPGAVRVLVTGDESLMPPRTAREVLLVLREARRNALRHARAGRITVTVDVTPDEVRATVEDDGHGFQDPEAAASGRHGGLLAMRERAALLGGSLTVDSRPGHGTRVLLRVPLAPAGGPDGNARGEHG
ncbi:sensor histidine kinase [Streptomyces mashuensis]|uniref:sensor histidine kinase n=1 Tax=Streptomyces mashuensis TaxID=33904 RepID=UPI00167D52DB|nr:ATP-binding protein [Streptomyces mashuensis]